mgnify:CR=1 FL=1
MVDIKDLTGIREDKKNKVIECLDDLLTLQTSDGKHDSIITGYNWYSEQSKSNRIITFSHMHQTETYKKEMGTDKRLLKSI